MKVTAKVRMVEAVGDEADGQVNYHLEYNAGTAEQPQPYRFTLRGDAGLYSPHDVVSVSTTLVSGTATA